MAASLTDKQIGNARVPIVCMVPGVGEFAQKKKGTCDRFIQLKNNYLRLLGVLRDETTHEISKYIESCRLHRQME